MIETIIKQYLDDNLSVSNYLERPVKPPKRFILFQKTSSSKRNHILSSTFVFQSYAETMYEAAELNEEVKQAVENMIELNTIAGITFNSDYNFTDTTTKEYRYQSVFDILHY